MKKSPYYSVAIFAGTDPTSGAGIQADIKAISATGGYAATIITALVSQNTTGVQGIFEIDPQFVEQQIESVFSDLHIHSVKIGMLHDEKTIESVATVLLKYPSMHIVLDPVMIAKNGCELLKPEAVHLLKVKLFSKATLITPNLPEAENILGIKIRNFAEMETAAIELGTKYQTSALVKGGHLNTKQSSDVLYSREDNQCYWYHADRIETKNTHGTGCSLSSAIASYLAQGVPLQRAVQQAKSYITYAIRFGSTQILGKGFGPIDHFYFLR